MRTRPRSGWNRGAVNRRGATACWRWGLRLAWLGCQAWLAGDAAADQWRLFTTEDGLRESLSIGVTVNPRGYLCVTHGTVSALSILDGYTVQNLPAPADRIHRVYQNRAGRIWAAYEAGLLSHAGNGWVRYPLTNQLTVAELNQLRAGRSPGLLPAQEDRVLMVLPERLVLFRATDNTLVTLREARTSSIGRFTDMIPGANGSLWLTGLRGVARSEVPVRQLDPTAAWMEAVVPEELGATDLQRPVEDDDGCLTSIGEAGPAGRILVHLDRYGRWETRSLPGESLRFAWRDAAAATFWGVTLNRLVQWEGTNAVTVTPPIPVGTVYDVAVQPRGVFWLATRDGVVRRAPSTWRPPRLPGPAPGLVAGFAEAADGSLWCATEAGLLHGGSNGWSRVPWPDGFEPGLGAHDGPSVLADGTVLVSATDGLWHCPPGALRLERLPPPDGRPLRILRGEPDGTCLVVSRSGDGAGGANTIARFDGEQFQPWTDGPRLPEAVEVFFLVRARSGDWWLGANAGPAWWRDGRWQFFGATDGYADDGALCWLEWPDGRIWCAGLGRIHEFDGRRWTGVRRGFDRVNAMTLASDGSVWVAANNGLHRFHRGAWLAIGELEGLPATAIPSVFETSRRELWVGTARGPAEYVPRADFDPPRTETIQWEQFPTTGGETAGLLTLAGRDRWRFTPDDRLTFSYRIDGREWSAPVPPGATRLRGLPQGRHEVEVRAMDRNWNEELRPQSLAFRISVPWHRDRRVVTVAVIGLLAALSAGAVAVNRHLQLRRSYADVERQVEERTRQLRRATDALAQGQKMTALGTLAAGIAHDFNNILSIIKGSAQIIAAHPDDHGKVLTRVSRILTMVDQASDVVRGLLGFGTATERTVKPCDANQLVGHTVRLLGDRFRRDLTVELELAADLPPVLAAADLVQQSLLNLIFNAADALDGAGRIVVATRRVDAAPDTAALAPAPAGAYVLIEVRDAGHGIPPEALPRIFEPFFTTKEMSPRPGRGLGLYMVYEFAKETGHGIAVTSQLGTGSTFCLILPVASADARTAG